MKYLSILLILLSCNKPEIKIKDSWTAYYDCKYFILVYDQLKEANPRVSEDLIRQASVNITQAIEKRYEVSTISKIRNKTLSDIAYNYRKVEVCYGDSENPDCESDVVYTESLVLNIDLTTPIKQPFNKYQEYEIQ